MSKKMRATLSRIVIILLLPVISGCEFGGQPTTSITNIVVTEKNGGLTNVSTEVSLSKPSDRKVSINYRFLSLDAKPNQDYMADDGELIFPPGETRQSIDFQIIGDQIYETDEDFMIRLHSPVNVEIKQQDGIPQDIGLVTIKNDDPLPNVSLLFDKTNVDEGVGILVIKAVLNKASAIDTRVKFSVGGTAIRNEDFTILASGFYIAAGKLESDVDLIIQDDAVAECMDTLVIALEQGENYQLTDSSKTAIRIHDDDAKGQQHRVGKGSIFSSPSDVSKIAQSGDVINIAAGTYRGDVAKWEQDDLLLCGEGEGVNLLADGKAVDGKGIWVIKGDRVTVQNINFRGAHVSDRNGAGIRHEGKHLLVRYSEFEENENGILVGNRPDAELIVEHSKFINNGAGDGQSHNIYVGSIKRFETRFSEYRGARVGHNIKSRAANNFISYNKIMDGEKGNASYQVDLPSGGFSILMGNSIQQGPLAENYAMISYGLEGLKHSNNDLILVNNTLVNDRHSGVFGKLAEGAAAHLINNLFVGNADSFNHVNREIANIRENAFNFMNKERQDYRLPTGSPAIDAGVKVEDFNGITLKPRYEYHSNGIATVRGVDKKIDVGAFEYRESLH